MSLERTAALVAIYPATWGLVQLGTGALSDRVGRKWLIAAGMWTQAASIAITATFDTFVWFAVGAVLLGVGTAMVYPTLLAAIGDVANPTWRASAIGVYRFWRDLGYAVGAVIAGVTADLLGSGGALWIVATLTFISGVIVASRMQETLATAAVSLRRDLQHEL
jgi:MFS family permease